MLMVRTSSIKMKDDRAYFEKEQFSGVGLSFQRDGWLANANVFSRGQVVGPFEHSPIDRRSKSEFIESEYLDNKDDEGYCHWLDLPQSLNGEPFGGVAFSFDDSGRCEAEYGFYPNGVNAYEIGYDLQGRRTSVTIGNESVSEVYKFSNGKIVDIDIIERLSRGHNFKALSVRYSSDGMIQKLCLEHEYFLLRTQHVWKSLIVDLPEALSEFANLEFTNDAILTGSSGEKLKKQI